MKLNFTSGMVLVLISIFVTPVAVLSYRALNSPPEPSTAPTTQIRMLDSPLARIPYLPLTSKSISGKPNRPTPEPATVEWGNVTNKPAGFADNLDNDALAALTCEKWELIRWNGSAWECFSQDQAALEERVAALEALHVPTPTPTIEPPLPGLVAWWPGEGNADDVVGANHGTLQGETTFSPGMVGQGFSFDGTDDFVLVPADSSLNLTGAITVVLWAKRTVFSGDWTVMVSKGRPMTYQLFFDPNNQFRGDFERDSGSDVDIIGPAVTDTNFHHYAYVRSNDMHKLFIDGVVVKSASITGSAADTSGLPLVIGGSRAGADSFIQHFGGIVDELQVFNRPLSDTEVKTIYELSAN